MSAGRRMIVLSERLSPVTDLESAMAEEADADLVVRPLDSHENLRRNTADAEVIIVGAIEPLDADGIACLGATRLIARRGVGLDNIDVETATRDGRLVTHVPDASVEEVSDQAIALAVTLCRRMVPADRLMLRDDRAGARAAVDASRRLNELTLGIVGFGRIGRRTADKGRSLFAEVVAHDPAAPDDGAVTRLELDKLLTLADVLSLHLPLSPATRGLIGDDELRRLPAGAVVVNTSRAGVIDELALERALVDGCLGGIGLDVSTDATRWAIHQDSGANVVLTGHTGARGAGSQHDLRSTCAAQVVAFLAGERPLHLLNPEVLADAEKVR